MRKCRRMPWFAVNLNANLHQLCLRLLQPKLMLERFLFPGYQAIVISHQESCQGNKYGRGRGREAGCAQSKAELFDL